LNHFLINLAQAAGGGGSPFTQFVPLVAIFAIFYFLVLRPQSRKAKEHQAMLADLKDRQTKFETQLSELADSIHGFRDDMVKKTQRVLKPLQSTVYSVATDVDIKYIPTAFRERILLQRTQTEGILVDLSSNDTNDDSSSGGVVAAPVVDSDHEMSAANSGTDAQLDAEDESPPEPHLPPPLAPEILQKP